ncbi:MAG TPA: hypothetical protein VLL08_12335 [Kineosporiaceae bacterium]|nr:hypothetical protein [Kineosporiaceae bacterium]
MDQISATWTWVGFCFPLAGLLGLGGVFVVHRPWFYTLQQEDYPVEWLQFGLCLFSGAVFALAAMGFQARRYRGLAILLLLAALGSLVLSGEEISWGQRVFGLVTPEGIADVNQQAEMNIHNISIGIPSESLFKLFSFAMGLAGASFSLLARRVGGVLNRTVWWLIAPPLLAIPGFLGMPLYRLFVFVPPFAVSPVVRAQEWIEVGLYSSLAITAACCYTRATVDRYQLDLTNDRAPVRLLHPQARLHPAPLIAVGVGILVLTLIFAIMTRQTDVLPGNI